MTVPQRQFGIGLVNSVLNLPWASEDFWGLKIEEVRFCFTFQDE